MTYSKNVLVFLFLQFFSGTPYLAYSQLNIGFENLSLRADTFLNGSQNPGGFLINNVRFNNNYNIQFQSWEGFSISSKKDTTTGNFTNQYSCISGKGHNNSSVYATAYESGNEAVIKFPSTVVGEWIYVNNSTYAYKSMKTGDTFAKKFGGVSGNDPDFFKLEIARWLDGTAVDTFTFFLADFRSSNNQEDFIVKEWSKINLLEKEMDSLSFHLSSSDNGQFGMNTPAYFCIDNLLIDGEGLSVKSKADVSQLILYPNPANEYLIIQSITETPLKVQVLSVLGTEMNISMNPLPNGAYRLNINDLPKGFYQLKVDTNKGIGSKSFIKK